ISDGGPCCSGLRRGVSLRAERPRPLEQLYGILQGLLPRIDFGFLPRQIFPDLLGGFEMRPGKQERGNLVRIVGDLGNLQTRSDLPLGVIHPLADAIESIQELQRRGVKAGDHRLLFRRVHSLIRFKTVSVRLSSTETSFPTAWYACWNCNSLAASSSR